jgi:hypothetical protein
MRSTYSAISTSSVSRPNRAYMVMGGACSMHGGGWQITTICNINKGNRPVQCLKYSNNLNSYKTKQRLDIGMVSWQWHAIPHRLTSLVMHSFYNVQEKNVYRDGHVRPAVSASVLMFQLENSWRILIKCDMCITPLEVTSNSQLLIS